jgi:hypothetical protein
MSEPLKNILDQNFMLPGQFVNLPIAMKNTETNLTLRIT